MIAAFLLSAAAQVVAPAAAPPTGPAPGVQPTGIGGPSWQQAFSRLGRSPAAQQGRGRGGTMLDTSGPGDDGGIGGTLSLGSGSGSSNASAAQNTGLGGPQARLSLSPISRMAGLFEFRIDNTVTGWYERGIFLIPRNRPTGPAPLMLAFHGFGSTMYGVVVNSDLVQECNQRGWYLLAPLGATTKSFSSVDSQLNTLEAIEYFLSLRTIEVDPDRVYAIGFSMGGGAALNFAARHLDPSGLMIAAAVNHTGSVSLRHVYHNEWDDDDTYDPPLEAPDILEFWHGGSPEQETFSFNRSSLVDIQPGTNLVLPGGDLARNLTHVPVYHWHVDNDLSVPYIMTQTDLLHAHMQGLGASSTLTVVPGTEHSWSTMDQTAICDWLAQHSLAMPTSGNTLIDHDGRYFYFDVMQEVGNAFSSMVWSVNAQTNSLSLSWTTNLRRVKVDLVAAGLDPTQPVTVSASSSDQTTDQINLKGIASYPSQVLRDGVPATTWAYNSLLQEVILVGADLQPHTWEVIP